MTDTIAAAAGGALDLATRPVAAAESTDVRLGGRIARLVPPTLPVRLVVTVVRSCQLGARDRVATDRARDAVGIDVSAQLDDERLAEEASVRACELLLSC